MIKRLLARLSRQGSKGRGQYFKDNQHPIRRHQISKNATQVVRQLASHGHHAYVVGGCLRDILMKKHPKDFDVATDATPAQVKQIFRRSRIIGRRFQIVHVYFGREVIEVTTFRGHHDSAVSERHAVKSSSGMLLRDNVYGSIEDDAIRRDFTANSLYFDPISETLIDFTGGVQHLKEKRLVTIGDPAERFREDPVRMLRAIRFEAKLALNLDRISRQQLKKQARFILQVSNARLFDEVIKLLMSGNGEPALKPLINSGLFKLLFPATEAQLENDSGTVIKLLESALHNTDERIQQDKPVTPAFLYAALLWPAVAAQQKQLVENGQSPAVALTQAANKVVGDQIQITQIPKRFSIPMREIWDIQSRLYLRGGNRASKMLEHPRFRAAYDFVLLREESGEDLDGLGKWWTDYQEADDTRRAEMTARMGGSKRRRRPRRRRTRKPTENG